MGSGSWRALRAAEGTGPEELLRLLDADGNGTISYSEFIAASLGKKQYREESALWAAFRAFDIDGSGTIDRNEVQGVINGTAGEMISMPSIARIFAENDANNDDQID